MKTKMFGVALAMALPLALDAATVRIVQTNAAGDSVMLIDPVTNKVVGEIKDIEVNHGAAAAPDGSRLYVTNEAGKTYILKAGAKFAVVATNELPEPVLATPAVCGGWR